MNAVQRYALGFLARRIPKRSRANVVAELAASAGIKEDSLYDYMKVAKTWTHGEFIELLAKGLTLSHLVLIARKRDSMDSRRASGWRHEACVDEAISKKLSVRDLKQFLKKPVTGK